MVKKFLLVSVVVILMVGGYVIGYMIGRKKPISFDTCTKIYSDFYVDCINGKYPQTMKLCEGTVLTPRDCCASYVLGAMCNDFLLDQEKYYNMLLKYRY